MAIFFPIAGVHLNIFLLLGLGVFVGMVSGLFGVGGGFLMTPLLMMIGVPPAVAAATDSNQITGAVISGSLAHTRMGHVEWKMGLIMAGGGITGSLIGTQIVFYLRTLGSFNFAIKIVYVVLLLLVGSFMFWESIRAIKKKRHETEMNGIEKKEPGLFKGLPGMMYFPQSDLHCSVYLIVVVGLFIGILAAFLGIGGGFILLPTLIYVIGLPTIMAVGTNLVTEIFATITATISQATVNHTVDVVMMIIILLGSAFGAQIGARLGKPLKAEQMRIIFSLLVLGVMVKILYGLLAVPGTLITLAPGGHL